MIVLLKSPIMVAIKWDKDGINQCFSNDFIKYQDLR